MSAIDKDYFTCQELVELVTNYIEGALTPIERARFEAARFNNRTRVIAFVGEHVPGKILVGVDNECHIVKERTEVRSLIYSSLGVSGASGIVSSDAGVSNSAVRSLKSLSA